MSMAETWGITRGDLDGFFGLMVDNLLQFLVILSLGAMVCGMPAEFVLTRVFPGAAVSLLVGNLYYSWLARRLSQKTGRIATALPYGINTVSLFAFVLFVIGPTYSELAARPGFGEEAAMRSAWQVGLVACLLSGIVEALGGLVADWIRRVTPRAALLSTLSGIALGFISMEFTLRSFDKPLVALAPLALVLVTYLGRVRWPLGLPGGLMAVGVGSGVAWILGFLDLPGGVQMGTQPLLTGAGWRPPLPALTDLWAALGSPFVWDRIGIILPMGLINALGSLQNIESAEAEGDPYPARGCMMVNGLGTMAAAVFGSCFPTTIYIGHPGWKRLGAGWAYSTANGLFFTLVALAGLVGPIARLVPVEAAMGILVWIAIIITTQAFTATPREHAPAVVLGLLPGLAAWGWMMVEMASQGIRAAGHTPAGIPEIVAGLGVTTLPYVRGLLILKSGFLFSATFLAAIGVFLAERRFGRAALWSLVAALFSLGGLMHAFTLTEGAVREEIVPGQPWPVAVGYLGAALVFLAAGWVSRHNNRGNKSGGVL